MSWGYYLAPAACYSRWLRHGELPVDVGAPYQKQTLRTRCLIDSPQGALTLSLPVEKMTAGTPLCDVRISDHGNWRHQHWQALCSSYRQSPFFDYFADDFAPFYEQRWENLLAFNTALHETVCRLLDVEGIREMPAWPRAQTYYQVFAQKHGFLPGLSIVDLLFNLGPESILYL